MTGYRELLVCLVTLASLAAAEVACAQDAAPEHGDVQDTSAPSAPSPPLDAETPGPAARMATSSLTLLVGAQVAPSAGAPFQVGLDLVLRAVLVGGLVLQPRLGASLNGTPVGAAWSWALHAGLGVGGMVPVGREVAAAISAGYDFVLIGSFDAWLVLHRLTAELALPVILGNAVLEPFLQVGAQFLGNGADGALGLGLRAGATW